MTRSLFVVSTVALLLTACSGEIPAPEAHAEDPHEPSEAHVAERPSQIRFEADGRLTLEAVSEAEIPRQVRVAGRVTLNEDRTARVGSFVEGLVETCCKSVGSYVKKEEVLAQIHSHAIHEVVAEVATTRAGLSARTAELEYARQAAERAKKLLELKAGSLQAVQEAQTALRRAENALLSAEADVKRADAHLEFYGLDADDLGGPGPDGHPSHPMIDILAPISGRVISRAVRLGDVVTPSSELYVLSDLSQLWVIAQVPEEHMSALEPGMQVSVVTRAFPDRPFPGRVALIGNELDPESMTVQVRCLVNNPGGVLKTGMYATVTLSAQTDRTALTAPEAAVQTVDDEPVVFVSAGEGRYDIRRVSVGTAFGDRVELRSGVREGEQVVVDGAFLLKTELLRDEFASEGHNH